MTFEMLTSLAAVLTTTASSIGFMFWISKKNSTDIKDLVKNLGKLNTNVAVITRDLKYALKNVEVDHDKIIRLEKDMEQAQEDINAQHDKIRSLHPLPSQH